MKANEIIEGNKLIAEFMGVDVDSYTSYAEELRKCYSESDLEYHSSWDWLMPVVDKLMSTKQCDMIIHAKNLVVISYGGKTFSYYEMSLIENVWIAVVEFIKWYNSQNK